MKIKKYNGVTNTLHSNDNGKKYPIWSQILTLQLISYVTSSKCLPFLNLNLFIYEVEIMKPLSLRIAMAIKFDNVHEQS